MDREQRLELAVAVLVGVVVLQALWTRALHRHLTLLSISIWGEDYHEDIESFAPYLDPTRDPRATLPRGRWERTPPTP